ncbi:MAG: hypothetical protein SVW57_13765, partial [Thermodesulfobacteriota bacterium]|nr:hypothetical protein [Thermodesulfobacteriota bacterium]
EQIALQSVMSWAATSVETLVKQPDGSWKTPPLPGVIELGYQDKEWNGAPWAITNIVWIPVEVYIVESVAKDSSYSYGKCHYWIDKYTATCIFKEITNREGNQWKTAHFGYRWNEWWMMEKGGSLKKSISDVHFWFFVDERLRHATLYDSITSRNGERYPFWYLHPELNPDFFTMKHLKTMGK